MRGIGPKKPDPERESENSEYRYFEELDDSEINDEDLTKYKTFGVG